jgi:hypothetical protein
VALWQTPGGILFDTNSGSHAVALTTNVGDLIVVVAATTGTTTDPTVTDNQGGTYTRITGCAMNASADEMHVYIRDELCQLAVSHNITAQPGASTGGGLFAMRISGMAKTSANAARQSAVQSNIASGTPACVLARPVLTTNALIGAVFNNTSPAGLTQPTSWTESQDVGYSVPTTGLETVRRDSGETGTTITWGGASPSAFCSLVVELDCDTPSASSVRSPQKQPPDWLHRMRPVDNWFGGGNDFVTVPSTTDIYPIRDGGFGPSI